MKATIIHYARSITKILQNYYIFVTKINLIDTTKKI